MNNWGKKGDTCNQELARINNHHRRKPPLGGCSNWQQKIPYWEKRFVSLVGSLSWKRLLETKKFTHLYDNIMKWDDSAAEAAFRSAKHRFYAKFHGLPCDVEPHNPDLYIDKIEWNAQVDYNLIQDLESGPDADDAGQHEPVVIFGDVLPDPYKDYSPYGWGDSDDKIKGGISDHIKGDQNGINWDDYIDNGRIIWYDCGVGGGNDWWVSNENDNNNNKARDQGWNTYTYDENDYKAGDQGWNTNTYDENDYKAGDQGWNTNTYDENDYKAGDQGWNTNTYDENDNKAGDQGWNTSSYGENGNKPGDQGWNTNKYASYSNVNNERHKTWILDGNNDQRSRSWRNKGSGRKPAGQIYGNRHGRGSTIQDHRSQRIHVYP